MQLLYRKTMEINELLKKEGIVAIVQKEKTADLQCPLSSRQYLKN